MIQIKISCFQYLKNEKNNISYYYIFISCETQKSEIIDLFNAENDPNVSCYRIPSIITAVNGDLIAMIDERVPSCGDLKWSRDINIVMRKSFDNGKTWTDIETIVDYPLGQSASDPSMILDQKTNTIFMFYNYMDLDNEKDIYYLRYKKSVDNGKSWSKALISLIKFQKLAGKKTSSSLHQAENSNSRRDIASLFSKSSKRYTRFWK